MPSLLLLAGESELLLDDALRVRDAATRKGTDASVFVGKGMQHDWPLTLPWLDESRAAWNAIRAFVQERSHSAPRPGALTASWPVSDREYLRHG